MNNPLDRKKECEESALRALKKGNFREAWLWSKKAVEHAFDLIDAADAAVDVATRQSWLKDSQNWLGVCESLMKKIIGGAKSSDGKVDDFTTDSDSSANSNFAVEDEDEENRASEWLLTKRPKTRLDDVVGMEELKEMVRRDLLYPMKYKEAYKLCNISLGGGALMYGPPGVGKTFVAKAIAGEIDAAFFTVTDAQIKNKYVGETEKNMRRLFEEAAKYERAVVFLDEVQSLLGNREKDKVNATNEFLTMVDGFCERDNLLLILGATNFPWELDEAVFRRLGKLIYVGMPDAAAREKIFELQFKGTPTEGEFPFQEFGRRSERFSGSDISRICSSAKKTAIVRMIENDEDVPTIKVADVLDAIQQTKPSVSRELLQRYADWEKSRF